MICNNCGRYNPDTKKECPYCGNSLEKNEVSGSWICAHCGAKNTKEAQACVECAKPKEDLDTKIAKGNTSKWNLGFWLGIVLNVIALLIGLLVFKKDTYERESFVRGWVKAIIMIAVIGVIVGVIVSCNICIKVLNN